MLCLNSEKKYIHHFNYSFTEICCEAIKFIFCWVLFSGAQTTCSMQQVKGRGLLYYMYWVQVSVLLNAIFRPCLLYELWEIGLLLSWYLHDCLSHMPTLSRLLFDGWIDTLHFNHCSWLQQLCTWLVPHSHFTCVTVIWSLCHHFHSCLSLTQTDMLVYWAVRSWVHSGTLAERIQCRHWQRTSAAAIVVLMYCFCCMASLGKVMAEIPIKLRSTHHFLSSVRV